MKVLVAVALLFTVGVLAINDPSFELIGVGNPSLWTASSDTFGSPICSWDTCGFANASDGDFFYWGGGEPNVENSFARQTILVNGALLSFQFFCSVPSAETAPSDTFVVRLGGTEIFRTNSSHCFNNFNSSVWYPITLNIGSLVDNTNKLLEFVYSHPVATTGIDFLNVLIDLVTLNPGVTSSALTSSEITSSPLTSSPLTTSPLTTSPVTSSPLTTISLTTGSLTSAAVTSAEITSVSITSGAFTSAALTTAAAPVVTSADVTSSEITSAEITSGAEPEITSGEVVTTGIEANTTEGPVESSSDSGPTLTRGQLAAAIVIPIVVVGLAFVIFIVAFRAKSKRDKKDPERGAVEMKASTAAKAAPKKEASSSSGSESESESSSGSSDSGSESGSSESGSESSSQASSSASSKSSKSSRSSK